MISGVVKLRLEGICISVYRGKIASRERSSVRAAGWWSSDPDRAPAGGSSRAPLPEHSLRGTGPRALACAPRASHSRASRRAPPPPPSSASNSRATRTASVRKERVVHLNYCTINRYLEFGVSDLLYGYIRKYCYRQNDWSL